MEKKTTRKKDNESIVVRIERTYDFEPWKEASCVANISVSIVSPKDKVFPKLFVSPSVVPYLGVCTSRNRNDEREDGVFYIGKTHIACSSWDELDSQLRHMEKGIVEFFTAVKLGNAETLRGIPKEETKKYRV